MFVEFLETKIEKELRKIVKKEKIKKKKKRKLELIMIEEYRAKKKKLSLPTSTLSAHQPTTREDINSQFYSIESQHETDKLMVEELRKVKAVPKTMFHDACSLNRSQRALMSIN